MERERQKKMDPKAHVGFWHGFASAVMLQPEPPEPLRFFFRDYDILTIDSSEAIQGDWNTFGQDFRCSVRKTIDQHGDKPQSTAPSAELILG